jgi:hypothetical protein
MTRVRIALALAACAACVSTGVASAGDLVSTPELGSIGGSSGQPCVFVGGTTIGNPLSSGTIVKGDPKTGVYTRCPY